MMLYDPLKLISDWQPKLEFPSHRLFRITFNEAYKLRNQFAVSLPETSGLDITLAHLRPDSMRNRHLPESGLCINQTRSLVYEEIEKLYSINSGLGKFSTKPQSATLSLTCTRLVF